MKKDQEKKVSKRMETRLARAGNNPVLIKALSIEDEEKRWNALRDAGFCGNGAGACTQGPKGTIAKCDINETAKKPYRECKFHRDYAKAWAAKHAPKKEAKPKKVTEMKPKAGSVATAAKPKVVAQERKAAGPPMPKDEWTPAQELLIEGYKAEHQVTRLAAIRGLKAAKKLG